MLNCLHLAEIFRCIFPKIVYGVHTDLAPYMKILRENTDAFLVNKSFSLRNLATFECRYGVLRELGSALIELSWRDSYPEPHLHCRAWSINQSLLVGHERLVKRERRRGLMSLNFNLLTCDFPSPRFLPPPRLPSRADEECCTSI